MNNLHTEVRPWGEFTILLDAPDCKVKRITVNPGKRLSLQRHQKRSEHWVLVSGEGLISLGKSPTDIKTFGFGGCGSSDFYIHQGCIHRVEASPYQPLVFIEVQRGSYFGEDDIERFEDDFGRA